MCGLDPVAEAIEALAEGLSEARRSGLMEAIERSGKKGGTSMIANSQAEPDSSTRLKARLSALSALIAAGLKSLNDRSRHAAPPQPA